MQPVKRSCFPNLPLISSANQDSSNGIVLRNFALRPFRETLAKSEMRAYRKRELRFLLRTETGAGAARYSAPHGCQGFIFSQPRPIATMGRGILLSGVRRQQQYHSQGDKRDHDQTSHGRAPFPACAAPSAGGRVKRSSRAVRVIAYPLSPRNTKRIEATIGHQPRQNVNHIGLFRSPAQSLSLSFLRPFTRLQHRTTSPLLLLDFCKN